MVWLCELRGLSGALPPSLSSLVLVGFTFLRGCEVQSSVVGALPATTTFLMLATANHTVGQGPCMKAA